ncbi:MAG: sigma-E processing peptidase SpoIIGA [Lachnospiraceae bacterium]|nr:sigma-E processing peptidase SpoIIGA [Lachnospiraceae bacterium]
MEYNIYVDVYFFVNFIMNFILLTGCGRMYHIKALSKNCILAAAAGAFTACMVLLLQVEGKGIQLITAIGMGRIAYGKERAGVYLKRGLILFFTAFCLNGALNWLYETFGEVFLHYGIKGREAFFYLLFGGIISILLGSLFRKEEQEQSLIVPVLLTFKEKQKKLLGLYDTGNELTEPLFGRPVHIAQYEALKDLLPKEYQEAAEEYFQTNTLELTKVTKLQMYEFTFLSYHSIGNEKGQLLGIRMDSAIFFTKAGEKTEDKVVIGLTTEKLSQGGRYQMIINRRLGL